jgi:hypothetical protein
MRRFGALSVGSSAALLFLALAVVCSRPAGAQDAPRPAGSGVPVVPTPATSPPPASGPSTATPPAPLDGGTALASPNAPAAVGTTASPQPTRREQLKAQTIDQGMSRLAAIQGQQEALEKERKEAEAALKEKLKEQKEKLKKLGVNVEESDRPPTKVPVVTPSLGSIY